MDNYRIDSHKLMFHPQRVASWLQGDMIYPINAEISISGACNHRCVFCSADYMGYEAVLLSKEIVHSCFSQMQTKGLKSVLFAGTGEPLVNKDAAEIVNATKRLGIDAALSTNGVLFTKDTAEECMEALSWIRFSVSAGTEETYKKIHQGQDGDLERVFNNIYQAAQLKKKYNWNTVLGVQIVMIPDNEDEIVLLAKKAKELGADHFSVKSYGVQPLNTNTVKEKIDPKVYYDHREELVRELEELNSDNFQAVYRIGRMQRGKAGKDYSECYAMPFHTNIDAHGNMWPCCVLVGMEGMCFGNIYERSFEEIWNGEQRRTVVEKLKGMKLSECTPECKLDAMNRYLHELKNPHAHVNFI